MLLFPEREVEAKRQYVSHCLSSTQQKNEEIIMEECRSVIEQNTVFQPLVYSPSKNCRQAVEPTNRQKPQTDKKIRQS